MRKALGLSGRYSSTAKMREEEVMRAFAIAAIALACSGCGSEQAGNRTANAAQSYGERVEALSDPARRAVFLRAIRDAGLDCQNVVSAEPAGRYREFPVWRATCRGGGVWTIVIAAGGVAQILNAEEARFVTDEPSRANPPPPR